MEPQDLQLLMGAAAGWVVALAASKVPGCSSLVVSLLLRLVPGPFGMGAMASSYVAMMILTSKRDAVNPTASGSPELMAWAESGSATTQDGDLDDVKSGRFRGMLLGLSCMLFLPEEGGGGLSTTTVVFLLLIVAYLFWRFGPRVLVPILGIVLVGRVGLYFGTLWAAPVPVAAMALSVLVLPAQLFPSPRVPHAEAGTYVLPQVGSRFLGLVAASIPGAPSSLITSLCLTAEEVAQVSGIGDGLAIAYLTIGGIPRTGASAEAAFAPEHGPLLWWVSAATLLMAMWMPQTASTLKLPIPPAAITVAAITLAGGPFAAVAIPMGLLAHHFTRSMPATRGFLFSAPSFV